MVSFQAIPSIGVSVMSRRSDCNISFTGSNDALHP